MTTLGAATAGYSKITPQLFNRCSATGLAAAMTNTNSRILEVPAHLDRWSAAVVLPWRGWHRQRMRRMRDHAARRRGGRLVWRDVQARRAATRMNTQAAALPAMRQVGGIEDRQLFVAKFVLLVVLFFLVMYESLGGCCCWCRYWHAVW